MIFSNLYPTSLLNTLQSEYECCHYSPKIYTNTRAIFNLKRRFVVHGVGAAVADLFLAPRVLTGVCVWQKLYDCIQQLNPTQPGTDHGHSNKSVD